MNPLHFGLALSVASLVAHNPADAQQLNTALAPVFSSAGESAHVLKAAPGNLYQLTVTNLTATTGYVEVFNLAAVPNTGAVTPVNCTALPASGSAKIDFTPTPPEQFTTGITAVVSSASNCNTYTNGTITAFFNALVN